MIIIKKGSPPQKLISLQNKAKLQEKNPRESFRMLRNPLKKQVLTQLVDEQGQLCAYCMCRIPRTDADINITAISIEHFIARNPVGGQDVGQGLDYNNFLAVCHGNRGTKGSRRLTDLTCDAHRENADFRKVNPTNYDTLSSIFYHVDGTIDAVDEDVRYDLIETLNLNSPTAPLCQERKAALDALIQNLGEVKSEEFLICCEDYLNKFELETTSKTPYVGILMWYLQDIIRALKEIESYDT